MEVSVIHCLASLYTIFIVIGWCTNSLIIIATIRTKSLHGTCNILIALCALSDILHQLGHLPKIIMIFIGKAEIGSCTCIIAQIIPNFGLSTGVILLLLIAIDRWVSIHFSSSLIIKHYRLIIMCHALAIMAYASLHYAIAYHTFENKNVICSPLTMFHGVGLNLWVKLTFAVIFLSVIVYYGVWKELENSAIQKNVSQAKRVFRSVVAVMSTLILGWLLTMSIGIINVFVLDLRGISLYIGSELAGIPANLALTLNCIVLYYTSTGYRKAFRRQLNLLPLQTKIIAIEGS